MKYCKLWAPHVCSEAALESAIVWAPSVSRRPVHSPPGAQVSWVKAVAPRWCLGRVRLGYVNTRMERRDRCWEQPKPLGDVE